MSLVTNCPSLSVVICTHNPRMDYLGCVLAALQSQTLPMKHWELLLIDNRSTIGLAGKLDLTWHPAARIIRENTLGLTPARLRAIDETRSELLVFCDDDGVLRDDYLKVAADLSATHPQVGAWGGGIRPEFEGNPPDWTREHWPRLAIRDVTTRRWSNFCGYPDTTPCGVGMCVRRVVAGRYRQRAASDPLRLKLDRKGTSLVSGGDDDMARTAHQLDLATGLFPELQLTHLIPASRLEESYLLRLAEEQSYSGVIVAELHGGQKSQLIGAVRQRIGRLKRRVFMQRRARRFLEARLNGQQRALRDLAARTAKT